MPRIRYQQQILFTTLAMGLLAGAPAFSAPRVGGDNLLHADFNSTDSADPTGRRETPHLDAAAGQRLLQVTGRLTYVPYADSRNIGIDSLYVEVRDDDTIGHSVLWAGYTNADGIFDTGIMDISDDDHEPDLYFYARFDTPIVQIDDDLSTYAFFNQPVVDVTSDYYTFGTVTLPPGNTAHIVDIHQNITRAHRYVSQVTAFNISKVVVDFPEGDEFSNDYDGEINLGEFMYIPRRVLHQYAHHIEAVRGMGVAAGNDCDSCHYCAGDAVCADDGPAELCDFCPINSGVARSEGFAYWFEYAASKHFEQNYSFVNSEPFESHLGFSPEWFPPHVYDGPNHHSTLDLSEAEAICGLPILANAQGVVRVIQSFLFDLADADVDDHEGDGFQDCAALGFDAVLYGYLYDQPGNILAFISDLISRHPGQTPALYATARNASTVFSAQFPTDTQPPGAIPQGAAFSPTHSQPGAAQSTPCISLQLQTPFDDVTGGCGFSIEWSATPDMVPDTIAEVNMTCPEIVSPPLPPGNWYACVRVQDCAGNWSTQTSCLGPYTINDCDNDGFPDVCSIFPFDLVANEGCALPPMFCAGAPSPIDTDCDHNSVPDACDIAFGADDCNLNGKPDNPPCELIAHWTGAGGSGWQQVQNWDLNMVPDGNYHACIGGAPADETILVSGGYYAIANLACYENIRFEHLGAGFSSLTMAQDSHIFGDMTLTGPFYLYQSGLLNVYGHLFLQNDGQIWNNGTVFTRGGVTISGRVWLSAGQDLEIGVGDCLATGHIEMSNATKVRTHQGTTYEFRANGPVFLGASAEFVNEGLFVRSAGDLTAFLGCRVINSGEIRAETGTVVLAYRGEGTGKYLGAPGATLEFSGEHVLHPTSLVRAETVRFGPTVGTTTEIHGTYDVENLTDVAGSSVAFHADATIESFGHMVSISPHRRMQLQVMTDRLIDIEHLVNNGILEIMTTEPWVVNDFDFGGQITGPIYLTVLGTMNYTGGASILYGGALTIAGNLIVHPSSSERQVDVNINNLGQVDMRGHLGVLGTRSVNNAANAVIAFTTDQGRFSLGSALLNNDGVVVKSGGAGQSTIGLFVHNRGRLESASGSLFLQRRLTQTAGETYLNNADMVSTGAYTAPALIQGGRLHGQGTFTADIEVAGCVAPPCMARIEPGNPIGSMNIVGDLTLYDSAVFNVELAGLTPITEHDQLIVSGHATVGGTLLIELANGFVPQVGDSFVILTATTLTANSLTVVGPGSWTVDTSGGAITITLASAACGVQQLADVNQDCAVDLIDHAIIAGCMGGPAAVNSVPCITSDLEKDGDVDLQDFSQFQIAW